MRETQEGPMLDPFAMQILEHWRTHRPRMVKELEESGQLYAAVEQAAEQTIDAEHAAMNHPDPKKRMSPDEAQQAFREEWAFLPSEVQR